MSDARERLLGIFREEAGERMDRMVEILLAVSSGEPPPGAIDALFRDAHSLKGGAGLVGLDELRAIAHAAEEILSRVRGDGRPLEPGMADRLLRATDAMRRVVAGEDGVAEGALADLAPEAAGAEQDIGGNGKAAKEDRAPAGPAAVAPLGPTVRVPAARVDRLLDTAGEAVLHHRGLEHLLAPNADERVGETLDRGEVLLDELQQAALELRALPVSAITGAFPRFVRELAVAEGKEVELSLTGTDTALDRGILEGLSEPLVHLLRNAIAHGIESPQERAAAGKPARGRLEVSAEQRGSRVAIEVVDDGRGVSPELLREAEARGSLAEVLAQPGFSTAEQVTGVAGRGVGLDAVKSHVEALGGSLEARSEPGRGTSVTLMLPFTLAILQVLLAERSGQVFGLPVASVAEVVLVADTVSLAGRPSLQRRGATVPLADLAGALGARPVEASPGQPALVVAHGGATVALACDHLLGEEHVVVKGLGAVLDKLPGYLGGAILGDGRVALIADPAVVVARGSAGRAAPAPEDQPRGAAKVLVVDDQFTVRELQRSILEAAGYRVETATDGRDALQRLDADAEIELVVTDLEMPEMNGLDLLQRIRREPELSSLPVVIVTSLASEEDRRRGLEAGADAYVTKDRFDQRALLETVGRLAAR